MFSKLGQRSTSWWICVTITGIFAASLLTVAVSPAFAWLCRPEPCINRYCGEREGPPAFCSHCNTGLNGGAFRHEVQLNAFRIWKDTRSDNCVAEVNTYHSVQATNLAFDERKLKLIYSSLVKIEQGDARKCAAREPSLDLGQWEKTVVVGVGETFTHARGQTVTWRLASPTLPGERECKYKGQAVTQVGYMNTGESADIHCPGPKEAVPNCR